MKIIRFKGNVPEWTIPMMELSKELRLYLRSESMEFIKLLNKVDDTEFLTPTAAANVKTLERIFTAADAQQ